MRHWSRQRCTLRPVTVGPELDGGGLIWKLIHSLMLNLRRACEAGSDLGQKRLSFSEQTVGAASTGAGRHSYFQTRRLQQVAAFN